MTREQRKVWGPEWGPPVKQTALLASPVYTGQSRGRRKKHIKRGAKIELGASLLFTSFGSACPHASCLEDVFSFACQIKVSCNTGLSIASNSLLAVARQNRGNDALPWQFQQCMSNRYANSICPAGTQYVSKKNITIANTLPWCTTRRCKKRPGEVGLRTY